MRRIALTLGMAQMMVLVAAAGCGSSSDTPGVYAATDGGTDSSTHETGTAQDSGTIQDSSTVQDSNTTQDSGTSTDSGSAQDSGTVQDSGTAQDSGNTDGGTPGKAGNPNGKCLAGIPASGLAVDTSKPTTIVGTGTPASCTFSSLNAAVIKGGIITFNCGNLPVTIAVTATINLPTDKNTVIDGGNKITLDGGNAVRILSFNSANFQATDSRLTLQHISLVKGKAPPGEPIPVAPAPCSQGFNSGAGGALYMRDGNLTVIDSFFTDNQGAPLGPDVGGGAIYVVGSKKGAMIVSSTFSGNSASNAGAVGGLFCELNIYDSLFTKNKAIGNGANNDDATKCSFINNGQHEIGSGGNGGAIYSDGNSVNVTLCGDAILDNAAGVGAFGGGLFFTSNNMQGTLTIADTTMTGNTGGHWTNATSGVKNAGTAVGVNCKSITITNSTIQGYP